MSTLAQLRSRVRFNLGEPNPGSQPRFDNASINNHINEGYSHYQQALMRNGEGDLATTAFINLVANQEAYPLPTNWVRTEKLSRVVSFGTIPLERFERYDTPNTTFGGNAGDQYLPSYRYRGRNIILEPFPTFSQTNGLFHEFYELKAPMVLDSDSPDAGFIEPWQSMLVLWATISEMDAKEAIGSVVDSSTFRSRLDKMEQEFLYTMNGRTQARDEVQPYGVGYDDSRWPY